MGMLGFATLAFALAAAAPSLTRDDEPVFTVADVAAAMQEGLPQRYQGGVSMLAVTAAGDVLIVIFDVPAAIAPQLDRETIAREFAAGFCQQGDDFFFEQGFRLRVDTSIAGGAPAAGILIDRCPGSPEAAAGDGR